MSQILQLKKIDSNHHDINPSIIQFPNGDREMTIGITNISEDSYKVDKFDFEIRANYSEEVNTQRPNMMRPMPFSGYPFQGKISEILSIMEFN